MSYWHCAGADDSAANLSSEPDVGQDVEGEEDDHEHEEVSPKFSGTLQKVDREMKASSVTAFLLKLLTRIHFLKVLFECNSTNNHRKHLKRI